MELNVGDDVKYIVYSPHFARSTGSGAQAAPDWRPGTRRARRWRALLHFPDHDIFEKGSCRQVF
ncbi:hypothetical protein [Burkholderia cepacia]|uniref:hypothetical protein n=1 Tax=Burkholderia cepacia TaxID=292 RepID=UPI000A7B7A63|nr:hypothetical protein [Burkholderia cepacia]